jgi:molybdate transport system ATP-binding protein
MALKGLQRLCNSFCTRVSLRSSLQLRFEFSGAPLYFEAMRQPWITLADVSARRGDRLVFKKTNWRIREGEYWAVIGAMGSGKTTLAQMLTSSLPLVHGKILYHFLDDPEGIPSPHEIIHVSLEDQQAMMSEAAPYYQARWNSADEERAQTVDDYLSASSIYAVSPFQVTGDEEIPKSFKRNRAESIRRLEIQSLLSKRLADLSNGESRKVLLARALAQRPAVLILDDPFAGLDQASRKNLARIVNEWAGKGMAMVLITPHPDDLPSGVTHVAEVSRHRLVRTGRRDDFVKTKPHARKRTKKITSHLFPTAAGSSVPDILMRMKNGYVRYGRVKVLHNINWTIRRGERWALLGPNGSGKTTLIGLIMGDHPQAYANDLTLFGKSRSEGQSIWEIKDRIGWVSPEVQMHFPGSLTGVEAVCSGYFNTLGLYRRCSTKQRRHALHLMNALGLRRFVGQAFQDLSPGEQRLILLARALVKNPWLLILDEPCQALDEFHRDQILSLIDLWARTSAGALIYVTHRREELPKMITHRLILRPA